MNFCFCRDSHFSYERVNTDTQLGLTLSLSTASVTNKSKFREPVFSSFCQRSQESLPGPTGVHPDVRYRTARFRGHIFACYLLTVILFYTALAENLLSQRASPDSTDPFESGYRAGEMCT